MLRIPPNLASTFVLALAVSSAAADILPDDVLLPPPGDESDLEIPVDPIDGIDPTVDVSADDYNWWLDAIPSIDPGDFTLPPIEIEYQNTVNAVMLQIDATYASQNLASIGRAEFGDIVIETYALNNFSTLMDMASLPTTLDPETAIMGLTGYDLAIDLPTVQLAESLVVGDVPVNVLAIDATKPGEASFVPGDEPIAQYRVVITGRRLARMDDIPVSPGEGPPATDRSSVAFKAGVFAGNVLAAINIYNLVKFGKPLNTITFPNITLSVVYATIALNPQLLALASAYARVGIMGIAALAASPAGIAAATVAGTAVLAALVAMEPEAAYKMIADLVNLVVKDNEADAGDLPPGDPTPVGP